jgi:predicted  nucleic acid-binding Zn-ribbon protein
MTPLATLTASQKLVYLQDLDLLLRDALEDGAKALWLEARMEVSGLKQLQRMRAELASSINPKLLELYDRIHRRHGRALVPVRDGTCLGCFVKLPTGARSSSPGADAISTCQSCGRILYKI